MAMAGLENTAPQGSWASSNVAPDAASASLSAAAAPNPLIYLDIWIFGGLVLVVLLVVTARFLWRSLKPDDRDPMDRLQPWEDPDYNPDDDPGQG